MAGVIVALDHDSASEALALVDRLGPSGTFYKVGLELFTRSGPPVVEALRQRAKRVFLDLKLHDIPNTVAGAVRAADALDVELLTLHASGGASMMEAAREAATGGVRLLGVTVLTSLTASEVEGVWGREINSIRDEVARLAQLAHDCGIDGVVASALEAGWIRRALGPERLIVAPGIRPAGADQGDQARVATPASAVEAGADYLVVGRPITQAADPTLALERLLAEVVQAEESDRTS
ncbi:MAG TPA: orotidine-5'-phosphate decarboxylase [Longimicrobiales bacterium]|nr:orotidine-5'-phosphate decarboxylase [Longimicrobiales bacterium]